MTSCPWVWAQKGRAVHFLPPRWVAQMEGTSIFFKKIWIGLKFKFPKFYLYHNPACVEGRLFFFWDTEGPLFFAEKKHSHLEKFKGGSDFLGGTLMHRIMGNA